MTPKSKPRKSKISKEDKPMKFQQSRQVEIFSAGCVTCDKTVDLVREIAGESDQVEVLDMKKREVINLAEDFDIRSLPTVIVTSRNVCKCCTEGLGPDLEVLKAAGLGQPIRGESRKRRIEIFSGGCLVCEDTINLIREAACISCDIQVLDAKDPEVVSFARSLGVRRVPSVVITSSKVAECCSNRGVDLEVLKAEGVGQPIKYGLDDTRGSTEAS
jgi:glutaredoxin 3